MRVLLAIVKPLSCRCSTPGITAFSQQALERYGVAPAPDQDVKHVFVLIDGPPEPMLPARDSGHNRIKVPFVSGCEQAADLVGLILADVSRPLTDCLAAHLDATGRQHLLNHASAERKAKVQPSGMADYFSRKSVVGTTRTTGLHHPSHRSGPRKFRV
jgi:hypothetical protein